MLTEASRLCLTNVMCLTEIIMHVCKGPPGTTWQPPSHQGSPVTPGLCDSGFDQSDSGCAGRISSNFAISHDEIYSSAPITK